MLRIAIQSKGRLNEESIGMLREIGILVDESKRKYLSKADNFPIEILYLRDDDIPGVVASGSADLGIVGLNEVEEKGFPVKIEERLGFGGCRISLAIPKAEAYEGPSWFEGKTIATSYPAILGRFLAEKGITARVVSITGSVEVTPAAGIADAIFDIVSSGSTLVANNLREVEKVFFSEAVLISNGSLSDEQESILEEIRFRLESARASRDKKYLLMNIPESSVEEAVRILPSLKSPTVLPLAEKGWCSLHSVVDTALLWEKVRALKKIGAEGILVLDVNKIIP
ncbi:MAG: ATP phosphoribosyltransferase [Bacteroidales bacterium]|nr:ATP phosphoribosyltransferase [Bacteroidales bacterium]MDY3782729.1 ATP phosphoribosyltransferase [Candidatus Cryptobacteroides sp.]